MAGSRGETVGGGDWERVVQPSRGDKSLKEVKINILNEKGEKCFLALHEFK
jgi:hypothetical protein